MYGLTHQEYLDEDATFSDWAIALENMDNQIEVDSIKRAQ